jgi:hypothetical protein
MRYPYSVIQCDTELLEPVLRVSHTNRTRYELTIRPVITSHLLFRVFMAYQGLVRRTGRRRVSKMATRLLYTV